jgi:hypothetical protein
MAAMPHAVPPTPPDVLAAAQALAPRLRALASDAERRRAMTDEAVDALRAAGTRSTPRPTRSRVCSAWAGSRPSTTTTHCSARCATCTR